MDTQSARTCRRGGAGRAAGELLRQRHDLRHGSALVGAAGRTAGLARAGRFRVATSHRNNPRRVTADGHSMGDFRSSAEGFALGAGSSSDIRHAAHAYHQTDKNPKEVCQARLLAVANDVRIQ